MHVLAGSPVTVREVYSNYFPKQWMILCGYDLQQSKSSEMSHSLGWKRTTDLPSPYKLEHKVPFEIVVLCSLLFIIYLFHHTLLSAKVLYKKHHHHGWIFFNRRWSRFTRMPQTTAFWGMLCGTIPLNNTQLSLLDDERHTRKLSCMNLEWLQELGKC